MKLFIVVNVDWFFLSHRLPIALAAQNRGWDVTIVTADTGKIEDIKRIGLKTINLPMSRSGKNIIKEFLFFYRLYLNERPDVVHHVGMKVILLGSIAAKVSGIRGEVNAVSGLGGLFLSNSNSIVHKLLRFFLRLSHHKSNLAVIFQNNEDKCLFLNNGIVKETQCHLIKGSGIDLNDFCYTEESLIDKIIILMTCRIIREKGVFDLISAAEMLRGLYSDKIEFWIAGGIDDHPNAITKDEMEAACDGVYIKWLGKRGDIKELLKQCHIFVFPSYYKEGLPKSLIEACAIGRPIVTTDNVGCRDVVTNGVNGYLVPIKDPNAIAEKISILIDRKELRDIMGMNGRRRAESTFSIDTVIDEHLNIYNSLL